MEDAETEKDKSEDEVEDWEKQITEENAAETFKGAQGTRRLKTFLARKAYKYTPPKENMVAVAIEYVRDEKGEKGDEIGGEDTGQESG